MATKSQYNYNARRACTEMPDNCEPFDLNNLPDNNAKP